MLKNKPAMHQDLLSIVSGERKGFIASAARVALSFLTPIYRIGFWFRNRKFDADPSSIEKVDVPVISIGNLTTGGTGKTPMVIWMSQFLRQHDLRVVIVSRGYGAKKVDGKTAPNDEALELGHRLPETPHLQDPDRVKSASRAVEELAAQVVLLDDGFQHRRLYRDLDIVLIDATNPFGYDRLLPRGLLREPIENIRRADLVIITRCENVQEEQIRQIESRIRSIDSQMKIAKSKTVAKQLIQYDGQTQQVDERDAKDVWFAFCAIGNPGALEMTLAKAGFNVGGSYFFPDHHHFSSQDLELVAAKAKESGATKIVCTHKDLVKVCANQIGQLSVYALQIDIEFVDGQQMVEEQVLGAR
jgi:tetraacyldisaccharide 4'-kinase